MDKRKLLLSYVRILCLFICLWFLHSGAQRYPLLKADVNTAFGGEEAAMMFTLDVPASTGQGQQQVSLIFNGTVTREGAMTGDINASDGRTGT